jgi:hypothetical protein
MSEINLDAEREQFEGTLAGGLELAYDHAENRYKHDHIEWQWQGWLAKARSQSDANSDHD